MSNQEYDADELVDEVTFREFLSAWIERHPEPTILIIILASTLFINFFFSISVNVVLNEPIYVATIIFSVFLLYISMQANMYTRLKKEEVENLEKLNKLMSDSVNDTKAVTDSSETSDEDQTNVPEGESMQVETES